MVRAKILRDAQGRIWAFSVLGHANAAPYGKDIACAAVSILTITTVNSLLRFLGEEYVQVNADKRGSLDCQISLNSLGAEALLQTEAILETMCLGLMDTQENYKSYIKVQEVKAKKETDSSFKL